MPTSRSSLDRSGRAIRQSIHGCATARSASRAAKSSTRSEGSLLRRATAKIASRSIPQSCAVSNITPDRCTRLNSCSTPRTKRAGPCGSARPVPATGFSIGVSRLQAALTLLGKVDTRAEFGPVVVTVFDRDRVADYQKFVAALRSENIRAELYLGNPKNMGNQLKYADRRNSPCVIIQGSDEKARGEVQIKDLIEGAKAAAAIASNQEWRESRPAQFSCKENEIVAKVREVLARHDVKWG